jgi:hypothetical protein
MTLQLTDSQGCSGHGREPGVHGMEDFFYLKSIQRRSALLTHSQGD